MDFISTKAVSKRHTIIRDFLTKEGYEAYIVLTPDNFYYTTGFFLDVAPWERPVAAVIPREGEPFLIMNELSTSHVRMAKERGSLAVEEVYFWMEHPSSTIRTYTYPYWTKLLAVQLQQHGIYKGTIACDSGYSSIAAVQNYLPKLDFVNEGLLLRNMRTVKCEEELNFMRQAAKLTDYGQQVWRTLVKPGALVVAVDKETEKQMYIKGASLYKGAKLECRCYSLSGPASASPHGTGGDCDQTFALGHTIVNIIIIRLNGYVVENERTWVLGDPTDLQLRALHAAVEACEAAAARMVAGNVVSSIDSAAQGVFESHGFGQYIRHRTGHGLGIAGHEFPHDVAFNHRLLREGEVWSAEPGIYIYGVGGFRHDDTVIVGKKRPEVITSYTKKVDDQIIQVIT